MTQPTSLKARRPARGLIRLLLFSFLAIVLLVLAFKGIQVKSIVSEITQAKFFWVFLSFLISVLALISRAYRWNLLIEPLGYQPAFQNAFVAVSLGYFANLALPRLGEVTRCGSLNKSETIPFNVLLGTVITERIIDVISLLACLCITLVIESKRLGNFISNSIIEPFVNKIQFLWSSPIVNAIIIIVITLAAYLLVRFLRSLKKSTRSWLANLLKGVWTGIQTIRRLQRPWLFLFHSILIWLLYYLSVYVALFAFSATDSLGGGAAVFLLTAGGIAMSAPVQGGIGAYHLLVSQGLVLYGLTQQNGLAFATLLHGVQVLMILVLGIISLFLQFFKKR